MQTVMTIREFDETFKSTPPGETFVYAIGDVALMREGLRDRTRLRTLDTARRYGTTKGKPVLLGDEERGLGRGYLTQRRLSPGIFEYRLTKNG